MSAVRDQFKANGLSSVGVDHFKVMVYGFAAINQFHAVTAWHPSVLPL